MTATAHPDLATLQAEQGRLGALRYQLEVAEQRQTAEVQAARRANEHVYFPAVFERRELALNRTRKAIKDLDAELSALEPTVTAAVQAVTGPAQEAEQRRRAPVQAALTTAEAELARADGECGELLTAALGALQRRQQQVQHIARLRGELVGREPLHDEAFYRTLEPPQLREQVLALARLLDFRGSHVAR